MNKLTIEIEYSNKESARLISRKLIKTFMNSSNNHDFQTYGNSKGSMIVKEIIVELVNHVQYDEMEYQTIIPERKIINGKICDVYKSRMNEV